MRFSPGCGCCGVICCGSAVYPDQYTVDLGTLAGVIFNPPLFIACECQYGNSFPFGPSGSWTITFDELDCTWEQLKPCGDFGNSLEMILSCDATTVYLSIALHAASGGSALYTKPLVDWDWMGTNTMDFDSANRCTGWAATVDVVPV